MKKQWIAAISLLVLLGLISMIFLSRRIDHQEPNREIFVIQQQADKAIIKFEEFSVAENKEVRFEAPNSDSTILVKIASDLPVRIDGTLTSNCPITFSASGGLLLGPNGRLNIPDSPTQ